ncbi:MAG: hypothetical protein QM813_22190 [Verrucomicrobiota bacterium]
MPFTLVSAEGVKPVTCSNGTRKLVTASGMGASEVGTGEDDGVAHPASKPTSTATDKA